MRVSGRQVVEGLQQPCLDARYPQLAGDWAVGCRGAGVNLAIDLVTGEQVALERAALSPAVGQGVLFAPTVGHGLWVLPDPVPDRQIAVPIQGAAGTDGVRVAVATADDIQIMTVGERTRRHIDAHPAPWYPPAVSAWGVAWVQSGEDIWWAATGAREGKPLADGPEHQRHVAASGRWVAWIQDSGVVIHDLERDQQQLVETDAHPSRALSLWGPTACWEHWNGLDVDVWCSDGLRVQGPGHQRAPSRDGARLLLRDQGDVVLLELDELVFDDTDPRVVTAGPRVDDPGAWGGSRVEGTVVLALPDLDGDWRVDGWSDGAWVPVPVDGGVVRWQGGDALRLTRE